MIYSRITTLFLAGSVVLLGTAVHAQASFSIGPRVGLNLSTQNFAESPPYGTPRHRTGLETGIMSNVSFGHLALQAAVLYSQKGTTILGEVDIRTASNTSAVISEYERKTRLNYITFPLALAYTQYRNGQGVQVFAGPYLGLLLSGNYATKVTSQSVAPITDSGQITPVNSDDAPILGVYARRVDAGLQAGLGYRYQLLLFQASYSLGLRNTTPGYTYNGVMVTKASYNRAFQASLTLLLGPKS